MEELDKIIMIQDLSSLENLLKKYGLPGEFKEIAYLQSTLPYSENFEIKVQDIRFTVSKKISGTNPDTVEEIEIIFSNTCKFNVSNIELNKDVIGESDDDYCFQIDIIGHDAGGEYYACWHLDKNIKSAAPKYTHPYYHLQFGGNTMETKDSGELLLLGSPRIPHPPMDLFLGFHFIINNFFSSKETDYPWVKKILNDGEYQEIMLRAQKRMWEPYFEAFRGKSTHEDFHLKNVFPLYMS